MGETHQIWRTPEDDNVETLIRIEPPRSMKLQQLTVLYMKKARMGVESDIRGYTHTISG